MIFHPRQYQRKFLESMESGVKRACLVWHRRAGKDLTALAHLVKKAVKEVGVYYYVFPSLKQARKIIWDGRTGGETDNRKFLEYLIDKRWLWPNPQQGYNNTEMKIRLRHPNNPNKEGSLIQLVGTKGDEADSIVGTNPRGMIFSEYSLQSPIVWEVMSPILTENGGWAVFVYTPRGRNHGYHLFQSVQQLPGWFSSILTVEDTFRHNGKPVITQEDIEAERQSGKREEFIRREYYCSFEGAADGAVYKDELDFLYNDHRVVSDLYNSNYPVNLGWDIGRDMTAIVFAQEVDNSLNIIDYMQESNKSFEYFARLLNGRGQAMNYRYGGHTFPHDLKHKEYTSGESRYKKALALGLTPLTVSPKLSLDDGIDAVRRRFRTMSFDKRRTEKLLDCLASYENEVDDETMEIMSDRVGPKWATHGCDALRTYVTAKRLPNDQIISNLPKEVLNQYDPFAPRGDSNGSWDLERRPSDPFQEGLRQARFFD